MNGLISVLKPPGMTSGGVVARAKRIFGCRAGHAGTLDPEAAGVLLVMLGKGTRLFDYLVDKEKTYVAELVTGLETDTQDVHGRVTGTSGVLSAGQVEAVLPRFVGTVWQVPPMVSALKRGGEKLVDLARQGIEVPRDPRPVRIDAVRLVRDMGQGRFLLRVDCGRGTYIRTLCHDIGRACGAAACMGMLIRTRSGAFTQEMSVPVEEMDESGILPMDLPLGHLPRVEVAGAAERFLRNGVPLEKREISQVPGEDQPVRLYLGDRFCGIGRWRGGALRTEVLLLET